MSEKKSAGGLKKNVLGTVSVDEFDPKTKTWHIRQLKDGISQEFADAVAAGNQSMELAAMYAADGAYHTAAIKASEAADRFHLAHTIREAKLIGGAPVEPRKVQSARG